MVTRDTVEGALSPTQDQLDHDFLCDFAKLSEFGATTAGGVDREALTEADHSQRRWLHEWLEARGFSVEYDCTGNQFGQWTWQAGAPYVLLGSHLDSQPQGGRFDGAYGVMAAAHSAWRLARRFEEIGQTPGHNIAVVNWFNEEGSRFQPSLMGSSVYTGKLPAEVALRTTDRDGITVQEALQAGGSLGTGAGPKAAAYAEIHIEQGRRLEDDGVTIGLVHATWAAQKYHLIVRGEQSHTGSTIIADRRDALLGAARLVVAAREIADTLAPDVHTSVGQMAILPNTPVVVAREVQLHLDLRSHSEDLVTHADTLLKQRIEQIEADVGVTIEIDTAHAWGSSPYDQRGVQLSKAVAEELKLSHRPIMTIAGHDSTNLKDVVPSVMLFVPSAQGISHNEREHTTDEDLCAGTNVLTGIAEKLVGPSGPSDERLWRTFGG